MTGLPKLKAPFVKSWKTVAAFSSLFLPSAAQAQETVINNTTVQQTGVSGLWILANISYAGMRAQNDPKNDAWRILAFIFGFPGTLISLLVVKEGSCRAYGIELPRKKGEGQGEE